VRRVFLTGAAALAIAAATASNTVHTAGAGSAAAGQGSRPAQPAISNAASAGALVTRYCAGCHNDRLKTGGLTLEASQLDKIDAHAETWEKVVQKLRAGVMPPAGAPRPDPSAYESLTVWIEGALDRAAVAHPQPGRRPAVHRLNRTEYRNAIRDLLDLDIDVASLLPADDSSYGFDNIGDILSISPTLLEAYLEAARRISQEAVGSPSLPRDTFTYRVSPDLTQDYRLDGLPFGTRGGMLVEHYFPLDGEYVVKAQLLRSFIGGIMGLSEVHQLEFSLDGHRVRVFPVGGKKPAGGDEPPQAERSSERPADADLEVRFTVKAGTHRVGVAFLERPNVQGEDFRPPYLRSYAVLSDFATGQPHVASVAITGPVNGTPGDTPSKRRIFVCRPEQPSEVRQKPDTTSERACARQILAKLARGAYRRPVNGEDLGPLLRFYDEGRSDGSFDAGIERALRRLLVSPEFLARIERDPASAGPDSNYRVTELELASRLSFFLWSSIPDEPLLQAAERGRLRDPRVLREQVQRMIADPRAKALVENFAAQWLYLRNVPASRPDTQLFPDFDDNLRQAMRRETELLFDTVIRENRSIVELLSARYTFVNERLARHYGMANIYGSHFRRIELTDDDARGGLLGQASILSVTSYPNRTSPVLRGKWILENILNAAPPPPPPDVPELEERGEDGKLLSMRERMVKHRANPVCASCHSRMDPPGLALEHFDAVGRWREVSESRTPIDATGTLPDGSVFDGPQELRSVLLRKPERFVSTLTHKLLTYALGRGLTHHDAPTIRAILRDAAADDYRFSNVVLGIVTSTPFQMRRSRS
jgi:hypothetical protein